MVFEASPHQSSASTSSRNGTPSWQARASAQSGMRASRYTPVHSAHCSVYCFTNSSYVSAPYHSAEKARALSAIREPLSDLANLGAQLAELRDVVRERHPLVGRPN